MEKEDIIYRTHLKASTIIGFLPRTTSPVETWFFAGGLFIICLHDPVFVRIRGRTRRQKASNVTWVSVLLLLFFFSIDLFSTNIPTTIKVQYRILVLFFVFSLISSFRLEVRSRSRKKRSNQIKDILEQWNFPLKKWVQTNNNAE